MLRLRQVLRLLCACLCLPVVAMAGSTAPKKLRVLAVGDSLTEGFIKGGSQWHPYANRLEQLLEKNFSSVEWEVVQKGALL